MPKQKTRKSITRRFRFTKRGKVIRGQSFARHLNVGKSRKRLRRLKRKIITKPVYAKKLKKALGIGK